MVLWGLAWRSLVLLASVMAPPLPVVIAVVLLLLVIGIGASLWRRPGLLGSAWRLILAVVVLDGAFWLGSPFLIPGITLAIGITIADLGLRTAGRAFERVPAEHPGL
jgi:hypothetical protein